MTQIVQAIYEQGVFRPLEPIALPEHERVSLVVSENAALNAGDVAVGVNGSESAEVLQRQREAIAEMRAKMDALPRIAPNDGLGGADHDLILYGWKK